MKRVTQALVLCLFSISGFAQENFNFELVSNPTVGERGNDVWGYVDEAGTEYAIMGSQTKTTIWSLEDPANPIERITIPGPAGTWRDIKSFEDHLYVTSDQGNDGLLIIDMSLAPDTITSEYWTPTFEVDGAPQPLGQCHNLYIDTEQGFCYLAGCDVGEGGVIILDLKDNKKEPVYTGIMNNNYSHDVFVLNDRMYTSDIFLGELGIYDISDKSNPVFINSTETSRRFTHNAWTSDDGNYVFTTDERTNAWIDAFDISDPTEIKFLDRYQPLETKDTGVIPHNTHYHNGFLVTSWYTDGVVVVDANKPDNLVKVASYDTELVSTSGFDGCWGAYPYLPSGLVLGSDRAHGLFVLQPVNQNGDEGYQRACYLEGAVTDLKTGDPIANTVVTIISDDPNESNSDVSGEYKTGQVTPGEFEVEFSHPDYDSKRVMATLISGEVTILDVQLGNTDIAGTVKDVNGNGVPGAQILIENVDEDIRKFVTTDEEGNWITGIRSDLEYNIYAAKWGYRGTVESVLFAPGVFVELTIDEGYEDDFFVDLGWTVSGNATAGLWELDRPNFIFGSGQATQQSQDIPTDLGRTYYVTGASGDSQGENDIDGGDVILTSPPMDFTGFDRIDFSYYLWFANVGGDGMPNDFVTVSITNGIETVELTRIDQNSGEWSSIIETSVESSALEFNDNMRMIVFATDQSPGHVVEAGFDVFKASGFEVLSTVEVNNLGINVFPNPTDGEMTLKTSTAWEGRKNITITNQLGQIVFQQDLTDPKMVLNVDRLPVGLYALQVVGDNKVSETITFSKI